MNKKDCNGWVLLGANSGGVAAINVTQLNK